MTHITVREWGSVPICTDIGNPASSHAFTRAQANALLEEARAHPLANQHGTNILIDRHSALIASQMVGVIAATGCSLEILPKIDSETEAPDTLIRRRLVRMLAVAYGLDLSEGQTAAMARQSDTLLDILIRLFSERLLTEARRGLPRTYLSHDEDLPTLRGALNIRRQFTVLAVRPDRLACRYDALSADTPLLRIMKACVVLLRRHARSTTTVRCLDELRFLLSDVRDVPASNLPWSEVHIDRTNRRWEALYGMACLFLQRQWQATHHDRLAQPGLTLLFPMNDLFETYIATLTKRALRGSPWTVRSQSGRLYCLTEEGDSNKRRFQTRPDLLIKQGSDTAMIIDTKWKFIGRHPEDGKRGVSQGDVYQMMAYARLYRCPEVMLLYPHHAGLGTSTVNTAYRIQQGEERLRVASVMMGSDENTIIQHLIQLLSTAGLTIAPKAVTPTP